MSALETVKAAYAALGRNDPSVLFGAMDPAINWNEAEGSPLADRNPYVGPQAVGEGVFGRMMAAIDNFTVDHSAANGNAITSKIVTTIPMTQRFARVVVITHQPVRCRASRRFPFAGARGSCC